MPKGVYQHKKGVYKHSEETKRKIGLSNLGNKLPTWSTREREKRSIALRGEKSHLWRGGITEANKKIRCSFEYKLWHQAVLARDRWTCVWCGFKSIKGIIGRIVLHVDHIKPFALSQN